MAPRRLPPGISLRVNQDGSKTYRLRWRQGGGTGPQCSHSFSRLNEAVSAQNAIKANGSVCTCKEHAPTQPPRDLGKAPLLATPLASLTLGRAIQNHARALTGVGGDYRRRYERDLLRHFADLADLVVADLTAHHVRLWIRGCEEGTHPWLLQKVPGTVSDYDPTPLSPVTTRRLLVQAGAVTRQLGLNPNPFAGHRVGRRDMDKHDAMKVLTPEEWTLLRDVLPEGTPRDLCTVLITTGLRWGEATALQVGDVHLDLSELRVRRAWKAGGELGPPKSARSRRTVDFGPTTHDALVLHIKDRDATDWVFTAPHGGPLHASNFHHRVWSPALDRAQAAGLTRRPRIHDLRHTAVSWQLNAGVPVIEVSRRVGHESMTTTTDRYGHLMPRASRSAVDAIERTVGMG
jgi:integrase